MFYTDILWTPGTPKTYEDYVNKRWVHDPDSSLLKKHVLARVANLFLAPTAFITRAMQTIIGLGAGIGAICTLGMHRPTLALALKYISASRQLVVHPFMHILRTLNPQAIFPRNLQTWKELLDENYKPPRFFAEGNGFITDIVLKYLNLENVANGCFRSNNFLKRHVGSRLTYALIAITCIVTRVADGIIGIPAAGLSILTGGKFASLNNLAYRALQAPDIITDIFICTIKFINPWA